MSSPSTQTDQLVKVAALGEPLRRNLYLFVAGRPDPVSRDQAADEFGISRAVAAFHLDKLAELGLLDVEFKRPEGRSGPGAGRPSKFYKASAGEVGVSLPPRDYELAGRLLAQAVTVSQRDGVPVTEALTQEARTMGRSLGRHVRNELGDAPPHEEVLETANRVLSDCGYEPFGDEAGFTLRNCPFHALAEEYRDLVCGMNLALMSGFTEELPTARLDPELDPAPGRCCVRLKAGRT